MKKIFVGILFILITYAVNAQVMIPGVVASSVQSSSTTLLNGLVYYWGLNETSGTTFTDEVSSAILTGSTVTGNQTGILGRAVDFTADLSRLRLPQGILYSSGITATARMTFSIWVKFDQLSSVLGRDQYLYGFGDDAGAIRFRLRLRTTDILSFWAANPGTPTYGSDETVNSSSALSSVANWLHIVVVSDGIGNYMRMYVNGDLAGTSSSVRSNTFTTLNYNQDNIGNNYDNSEAYATIGLIDDIAIYRRAMSEAGVDSLYNGGAGINPFNP